MPVPTTNITTELLRAQLEVKTQFDAALTIAETESAIDPLTGFRRVKFDSFQTQQSCLVDEELDDSLAESLSAPLNVNRNGAEVTLRPFRESGRTETLLNL
jgi:hypothetical protein